MHFVCLSSSNTVEYKTMLGAYVREFTHQLQNRVGHHMKSLKRKAVSMGWIFDTC